MVSLDNHIIKQQFRSSKGGTKDLTDLQVQVYEAPGSGATERDLSNWFAGLKAEIGCFGEICIFLFPYIKIATMRCK